MGHQWSLSFLLIVNQISYRYSSWWLLKIWLKIKSERKTWLPKMRVRSLCYVLSPSQGGLTTGWSLREGTETPEQSSLFWEPFCALGLKCYLTSQPSDDSLSFSIISVFTVSSVSQSFFPLLPSVSPCLPFWPQVSSFCSLPFHFLKSQSRKEAGRSEWGEEN